MIMKETPKRDERMDDPHEAYEAVVRSMRSARELGGWDTAVVCLGGTESLISLLAAVDVFTPSGVLAISTYSVGSNSRMPATLQEIGRMMPVEQCTIDITRPVQETMQSYVGLRRIELEQLHFSMDRWQKAEAIASLRSCICRAIAIRHGSLHVEAHSLSKITSGWVVPTTFDWNPVAGLTRAQLSSIAHRRWPGMELLSLPSGLDVEPDGGPRPSDLEIDVDSVEPQGPPSPCNRKVSTVLRLGVGIYQEVETVPQNSEKL
jgi:hypothetical protein